mgnify:CR=1 FL=1
MIWLIFIAVMLLSWLIQTTLQSRFNKYSRVPSPHGLTGADIARLMLRQNGINDVTVQSVRGRLTDQQEQEYRQIIENYRLLEADLTQPNRETRLLELDNQFHRKAFEITGMEAHFDHMLGELQHVERIRKFSLQTNENKSVCAAHTRILEMVLHGTAEELGEALESHLSRYKQTVEEVQRLHPDYFTDGLEP